MRRNGYLWTSGVNLHTVVRFADPDFLLECKISAIQRRFPFIFAFYMLNVRHISTSGFLTYWPRKYTMSIIPTRSEVDMTIHCRVVAFLSADMSWDLWPVTLTLTFWPWTRHTWRVTWSTLPPRLSVVEWWLPLKMRTRPLSMRRITWPVSRESKTITFLESPTPICFSL